MVAVCYLGFSITWFWAIGRLGLCFSLIVPHLVQKCCSTPNYGPKSKSKMPAVRHIGFWKIRFLSTEWLGPLVLPIYHLCTKFGAKMLIDAKIMAQNRPPSWICYLIILDHPRSLFIGPHRPFKFYANPMYSFEDMTIWNFCRFGLKCLFTPPKFWFWGVWTPKRDWLSSIPQKAPPWPKPHLHANFCADRSPGATCAWAEGIKKREKLETKAMTISSHVVSAIPAGCVSHCPLSLP